MNKKELKTKFIFIPIICAVMVSLIIIYRFISVMGLLDIDFSAIDNRIIKSPKINVTEASECSLIPRQQNIGNGNVDINRATAEELESLPGIGPKRASAIIEQRIKMGGFSTLRDIVCVEGIGEETYKKIEPYIKIGE